MVLALRSGYDMLHDVHEHVVHDVHEHVVQSSLIGPTSHTLNT